MAIPDIEMMGQTQEFWDALPLAMGAVAAILHSIWRLLS